MTQSLLQALRQDIPYRWRLQSAKAQGCECVATIDARQVMDRLDEVMGAENWQDHYREVAGRIYCDLSLRIQGEWITKSDSASELDGEATQAGDAFKRAAVKWGIGRFLYDLEPVFLNSIEAGTDAQGRSRYAPADDKGRRIHQLASYIQHLKKQPGLATHAQKEAIRRQCQLLGWSSEQLQTHLQRFDTSWKLLTQPQATRLLDELESRPQARAIAHN